MQRICLSLVLGLILVGSAEAARPTKYQVTVNVSAGGSVTSSTGGISCPGTCSTSVNSGTALTFTATPDPGATFTGWGGDCAGTSTTCSLTISAPTSVSAAFEGGGSSELDNLKARVTVLEDLVDALQTLLAGVGRVIPSETGVETILFSGVNVQITNGSSTASTNGSGNLILGGNAAVSDSLRSGSHNLVIGDYHSYSYYGGIVSGIGNTIGPYATAISGQNLEAVGSFSTIIGGVNNTASGTSSVILSGQFNSTSAGGVVVGGYQNLASGGYSVAVGGRENQATASNSVITGGAYNIGVGPYSTIVGGDSVSCGIDGPGVPALVCGEGSLSPVD